MAEPTDLPIFDENDTNTLPISTELQDDGFSLRSKPASGTFNSWFRNVYKWTEWFQEKFWLVDAAIDKLAPVDSIADLRAITYTPLDGQVVQVLGYYAAGDGGGGPSRVWVSGEYTTSDDNGGSVIIVDGVTTGAFTWPDVDETNLSWWGWGSETESINELAWKNAITYGSVIVPSGTTLIQYPLEAIPSNRTVSGMGIGRSIIKLTDYASEGTVATVSAMTTVNDAENIMIQGISIDGNKANQTWVTVGSANYCLSIRSANTTVKDSSFYNCTANGTGVPITGHDVTFENVLSYSNGKKGFYTGPSSHDIAFVACRAFDNEGDDGFGLAQGGYNLSLSACLAYNNSGSGIRVGLSSGAGPLAHITINGCITYNNVTGINCFNNMALSDMAMRVIVNGNISYGNTYGMQIVQTTDITVSSNQIYQNDREGIRLQQSRKIMIKGNQITDNGQSALGYGGINIVNSTSGQFINDLGFIDITDNFIADTQLTPTQSYGIKGSTSITAFSDMLRIKDNIFTGNITKQINWGTNFWLTDLFYCSENIGYKTETQGAATILSGQQFVDVAHGLVTSPTTILATGNNAEVTNIRATLASATDIRLYAVDGITTADRIVYWSAKVR